MSRLVSISCFILFTWIGRLVSAEDFSLFAGHQLDDTNVSCAEHQTRLSEALAGVSSCAVRYARPITVCRDCASMYNETVSIFKNLNGTQCYEQFFLQDRLVIVQMVFDGALNVWEQGKCDDCYQKNNYSQLSDDATKFFDRLQITHECFDQSHSVYGNKMNVCSECKEHYENLTSCYESFINGKKENGVYEVCIDIVDAMNITRHHWNVEYRCRQFIGESSIGTLNIVMSVLICLSPLAFFIFSRFFSVRDSVEIFKSKRRSFVQNDLSQ